MGELVRADAPLRLAAELTDDDEIARAYETLLAAPRPRRRRPPRTGRRPPLVSAIVPYFRAHRFVRDTVEVLAELSARLSG